MTENDGYVVVANIRGFISFAVRFIIIPLTALYVCSFFILAWFISAYLGESIIGAVFLLLYTVVGVILLFNVVLALRRYEVYLRDLKENTDETEVDLRGLVKIKVEDSEN